MDSTHPYSTLRTANESLEKTGGDPIQILLSKGLIARASILARNGHLKKAENLLIPLVSSEKASVDSICLLAKIYAQQDRLPEAKALWGRAYEMDTSHSVSPKLLERHRVPRRSDYLRLVSSSFAFTLLLFLVFWGVYLYSPPIQKLTTRLLAHFTAPAETKQEEQSPLLSLSPTSFPVNESFSPTSTIARVIKSIEDSMGQKDLLDTARRLLDGNENWRGFNLQIEQQDSVLLIRGEVPNLIVKDEIEQALRAIPDVNGINSDEIKLIDTYVVQRGDKLMDIAEKLYGNKGYYQKIAEANHLASPNDIKRGQTLRIPRD